MKKIITIGIFLLIITALGYGLFMHFVVAESEIRTTLSDRSKEYLQERTNNTKTSLKYAAIDKKSLPSNTTEQVGNCFRLKMPFQIKNVTYEKDCSATFALRSPSAQVVVYEEKGAIDSVSEVPGVSMRRIYTDTYAEEVRQINGQEYAIFSRIGDAYEKSAFTYTSDSYFVLNLLAPSQDEMLDAKFDEMLASVEFMN